MTRALKEMAVGAANNDPTSTINAHMAFQRAFYDLSEHTLLLESWKRWEAAEDGSIFLVIFVIS